MFLVLQKIEVCLFTIVQNLFNFCICIAGANRNKLQIISSVGNKKAASKSTLPVTLGPINQFTKISDLEIQEQFSAEQKSTQRRFKSEMLEPFSLDGTQHRQTRKDTNSPRAIKLSLPEDSIDVRSIRRQRRRRQRLARQARNFKSIRKQHQEVVIEMSSPENAGVSQRSPPASSGTRVRPISPVCAHKEFSQLLEDDSKYDYLVSPENFSAFLPQNTIIICIEFFINKRTHS